jgi:crotonobetainyl-CoA:carnitine CoA-transferase CaiB-like acyl-CoA transferase
MLRSPVLMDHDGPDIFRAAPLLAQHTEEVLRELGYSKDEIDALAGDGAIGLMPAPAAGEVA